jgi:hypothetical protein
VSPAINSFCDCGQGCVEEEARGASHKWELRAEPSGIGTELFTELLKICGLVEANPQFRWLGNFAAAAAAVAAAAATWFRVRTSLSA